MGWRYRCAATMLLLATFGFADDSIEDRFFISLGINYWNTHESHLSSTYNVGHQPKLRLVPECGLVRGLTLTLAMEKFQRQSSSNQGLMLTRSPTCAQAVVLHD